MDSHHIKINKRRLKMKKRIVGRCVILLAVAALMLAFSGCKYFSGDLPGDDGSSGGGGTPAPWEGTMGAGDSEEEAAE